MVVQTGSGGVGALGPQLAAVLPPFDPLQAGRSRGAGPRLLVVSLLLHLLFFLIFHDFLLGRVIEKDDVVIVRMLEEPEPKPEPPRKRRKVLAQRRVDASVKRFKTVAQPKIVQVRPVPVLDQTRRVEVDVTHVTEAPKRIERRKVVTETVSVFAEVMTHVQPIEVDRVNPEVRRVRTGRASAGPRILEAAGPVTRATAVDIEAPQLAEGVLSRNAVSGTLDGARIASLESGVSNRFLEGTGRSGLLSGIEKDCNRDPVCLAYLQMIRDRVYGRWHIPPDLKAGRVVLRFRIDRGGSAHGLQLKGADDAALGNACLAAFRHASPFPPPPEEIRYIINENIRASFDYGN